MKKILILLIFITSQLFSQIKEIKTLDIKSDVFISVNNLKTQPPSILATPSNDNCNNAIQITQLNGTCNGLYTTVNSTFDLYWFGSPCQHWNGQVWFYFVAQGPNVEITVQGGTILAPEIVLFAGTNICTTSPTITYGAYCANYYPSVTSNVSLTNQTCTNPLTIGQTYYFTVDARWSDGTFCVSVNNPTPNPAGTDCATANIICSNTSFGGNANLWGNCELTTSTIGGCLGQWGEVNSSWYVVYVDPTSAANATLTFTISPSNGTDDYDYSIWKGATCTLGTPKSCNFSSTVGNTGLQSGSASTSQGVGGTTWNAPLITQPGDVYIVLINGYTPASSSFNFNFGGSAILGCNIPNILPIELISFIGEKYGDNILLKWTTASEINNDYFIIENSQDGINFKQIDKIKGSGNSTQINNYSLIDNKPYIGITYYRLTQVDFNGLSKTFKIISVIKNNTEVKIIKITNIIGQDVNEDYNGVKIYYFNDGSVIKNYKE